MTKLSIAVYCTFRNWACFHYISVGGCYSSHGSSKDLPQTCYGQAVWSGWLYLFECTCVCLCVCTCIFPRTHWCSVTLGVRTVSHFVTESPHTYGSWSVCMTVSSIKAVNPVKKERIRGFCLHFNQIKKLGQKRTHACTPGVHHLYIHWPHFPWVVK